MRGRRDSARIEPLPPVVESWRHMPETIQRIGAWVVSKISNDSPETKSSK